MDMSTEYESPEGQASAPPVRIFDTTLRDGEQTPGVHFSVEQKIAIAHQLDAIGVDTIEAGFPASSPGDANAVQAVAREIPRAEVAALARATRRDIEAALHALDPAAHPVLHVVLSASDVHLHAKLDMTRAEALRRVEDTVRFAADRVDTVQFSPEDATRAERAFLRQMVMTAIGAGATRINIPDTVGCAIPREYAAVMADIVRAVPDHIRVGAHCHNDLGMATANSVAAVEAGARELQVTVNGIGERAGNAALEEVVAALHLKRIAASAVRLDGVAVLSRAVADASRITVQPNKAIVGEHAFAHSSGIHQDGILKDPQTYAFVAPDTVGAGAHRMVLTARSGRSAVTATIREQGFTLAVNELEAVYQEFVRVADTASGEISPEHVRRIVTRIVGREPVAP